MYNIGTGESLLKKKKKTDNEDWSRCGMEAEINDNVEIVEQSHRNLNLENTACVKKTHLRCKSNNNIFYSLLSPVNLNGGRICSSQDTQ